MSSSLFPNENYDSSSESDASSRTMNRLTPRDILEHQVRTQTNLIRTTIAECQSEIANCVSVDEFQEFKNQVTGQIYRIASEPSYFVVAARVERLRGTVAGLIEFKADKLWVRAELETMRRDIEEWMEGSDGSEVEESVEEPSEVGSDVLSGTVLDGVSEAASEEIQLEAHFINNNPEEIMPELRKQCVGAIANMEDLKANIQNKFDIILANANPAENQRLIAELQRLCAMVARLKEESERGVVVEEAVPKAKQGGEDQQAPDNDENLPSPRARYLLAKLELIKSEFSKMSYEVRLELEVQQAENDLRMAKDLKAKKARQEGLR